MTITAAALRQRLPPDPEEDVETGIYVRPMPVAWDALKVLEIMRRLPPPTPPPPKNVFLTPPKLTDPPPPWVHTKSEKRPERKPEKKPAKKHDANAITLSFSELPDLSYVDEETARRSQLSRTPAGRVPARRPRSAPRRARAPARPSIMPWVVFAMCFAIAFGISHDRKMRAQLASDLRAAPARVIVLLHSLVS